MGKEIFISDCNFTAEGDAATANEQYVDDDNANEQYGDDNGIDRGRRGREREEDPYSIEFCIIENRV